MLTGELMQLNFSKMVPVKSYQHVLEQIQGAICDGTLQEGDRLPSELKLKDMFNTSRGTVREALRVLEQKGLVSIRTGVKGGATVKEMNTEAMQDSMALLIQHRKVSLEHLAEFRQFLEGYAAQKAASLQNRTEIKKLLLILDRIKSHVQAEPEGWEEFHRLDALFHQQLARMAENPLVAANLETIHQNIHVYFQQYLPFSRKLLHEDLNDLCIIAEAVRDGKPEVAGEAARNHVARFNEHMEKSRGDP